MIAFYKHKNTIEFLPSISYTSITGSSGKIARTLMISWLYYTLEVSNDV